MCHSTPGQMHSHELDYRAGQPSQIGWMQDETDKVKFTQAGQGKSGGWTK